MNNEICQCGEYKREKHICPVTHSKLEQENEKLKADVAMLREACNEYENNKKPWAVVALALSATTSSDAWLNEQKAKVLEDAAGEIARDCLCYLEIIAISAELRSPESDLDQAQRLK